MRTRRQEKLGVTAEIERPLKRETEGQKEQGNEEADKGIAPHISSANPERGSPSTKTVVSIRKTDDYTSKPSPTSHHSLSPVSRHDRVESMSSSRLPRPIRFPLVALLSLAFSAITYTLAYPWTKLALAPHARALDSWPETVLITGWRIFELGLGWFGDYDSYDLAALTVLSRGPLLYLLGAFYEVPTTALVSSLAIETLSTYIPVRLLRPLSIAHADPSHAPNGDLISDKQISLLTSLFAATVYSVNLSLAYATYLPTSLVVYFNDIPSIASAHEASFISLLPVTIPLGLAATIYIYTAAEAEPRDKADKFDPVRASLKETMWWNVWGWSVRTKLVIKRTALLMLVTGVNTTLETLLTVDGVETLGALIWSSVWVLAAGLVGMGLGAVGRAV